MPWMKKSADQPETGEMKNWRVRFLNHLESERGLAVRTREAYSRDLDNFVNGMAEVGITDPDAVNEHQLRAYIAGLHRKGLSGRSLQRLLSAIRTFYQYLLRENAARANPALNIRAPRSDKRLPATLDVDAMNQLLDIKETTTLALRDKAIMEVFYSSGLRLSELATLQWDQIDLSAGMVSVTGKGGKARMVPLGSYAIAALQTWRKASGAICPPEENHVFVSRLGKPIATRTIQSRIKYWAKRQGLAQRVFPHLFRHSFASHMLESSGDLRAVQELLGHADIATTQIYTHLDFQHLAKVYDKTHPRARSGGKSGRGEPIKKID
jgi:integrase/recombinase XerC